MAKTADWLVLDRSDVWLPAVGLLLLAVLMVWLSTRTFRTYQKAV